MKQKQSLENKNNIFSALMEVGVMKWIFATILFFPLVCSADWFGPKNYDDCIIQGMQGTTSNLAAQEIKKACRSKFPSAPMPQARSKTVSGQAANQALNNLRLSVSIQQKGVGEHLLEDLSAGIIELIDGIQTAMTADKNRNIDQITDFKEYRDRLIAEEQMVLMQ